MIIVTGAAGFIGSCLVGRLNAEGIYDIVAVDDFSDPEKNKNLEGKIISAKVHRDDLFKWLIEYHAQVTFVFHIGARTDTTEFDTSIFDKLNLNYSKEAWTLCSKYVIPLVYASSAATYGLGEFGYDDDQNKISKLKPLNPYGDSKNDFDKWAIKESKTPPY